MEVSSTEVSDSLVVSSITFDNPKSTHSRHNGLTRGEERTGDFHVSELVEEDVGWFEVVVDDRFALDQRGVGGGLGAIASVVFVDGRDRRSLARGHSAATAIPTGSGLHQLRQVQVPQPVQDLRTPTLLMHRSSQWTVRCTCMSIGFASFSFSNRERFNLGRGEREEEADSTQHDHVLLIEINAFAIFQNSRKRIVINFKDIKELYDTRMSHVFVDLILASNVTNVVLLLLLRPRRIQLMNLQTSLRLNENPHWCTLTATSRSSTRSMAFHTSLNPPLPRRYCN